MTSSSKITLEMHNDYSTVFFSEMGCLKGTFSLQMKRGAKYIPSPTQMQGIHITRAIQKRARTPVTSADNCTTRGR